MFLSPRYGFQLFFVLSIVFSSVAGAARAAEDADTLLEIEEVDEYTLFNRFSPEQRAAIYPTLDAGTKSRLWRRHLEIGLEKHRDLPAREWAEVQEAIDLLTPALFADLRRPESPEFARGEEAMRQFAERTEGLFRREGKSPALLTGPPPAF